MLHNEDTVYTKDYGRNQTADARHERKRKGIERNLITEKKIKEQVIKEWCTCGLCKTRLLSYFLHTNCNNDSLTELGGGYRHSLLNGF